VRARCWGILSVLLTIGLATTSHGQLAMPGTAAGNTANPLTDPTVKPGKMILFDLEARFAKDVQERGGAAFGDWFAEDGVELSNGAAPVVGRVAIVKDANWSPKEYQLTWTPTDAMMGPSGDMGYTWGRWFWTLGAMNPQRQAIAANSRLEADHSRAESKEEMPISLVTRP